MKTRFLETATLGKRFVPAFHASLVLGILASFACIPAAADTFTFSVAGSATLTFPDIANVSYTPTPGLLSLSLEPYAAGNAGLVYDKNSQSVSWNNGILSYNFAPATGFASSPLGDAVIRQRTNGSLSIVNTNNTIVEIPITASVTYAGSVSDPGHSESEIYLQIYSDLFIPSSPTNNLDMVTECFFAPSNCYKYPGNLQEPTTSPVSVTSDLLVPANSGELLDVVVFSFGSAAVPEPGTLTLLGTGLIGLVGVARRKG